jgi:hypothetical protein
MNLADTLGMIIGFTLTLFVFSYILGDNALFRIAIHIFVGVAAGYVTIAVFTSVIWPQLVLPLLTFNPANFVMALIPALLSVLLLLKAFPGLSGLGKPVVAYLVGVAAAAAIGGAILGTVLPQAGATVNLFSPAEIRANNRNMALELFNASIILVGTVTTLAYFHFGVRSSGGGWFRRIAAIEWMAWVGQVFIAITFGALFAGVYAAALSALVERWQFIYNFVISFIR